MPKDYAKRVFTTTRKPKALRRRVEFIAIPLILIVLIGLFWVFSAKKNLKETELSWVNRIKSHLLRSSENAQKLPKITNPPSPTESEIHFDFYKELPDMQVGRTDEPPITPKIHDPEAPLANKEKVYFIKLGQAKDYTTVSQLRLSLLLSGIEAEIVKIKSPEGMIYQVQRGPFTNQAAAKKLLHQIQKKGIECELKQ